MFLFLSHTADAQRISHFLDFSLKKRRLACQLLEITLLLFKIGDYLLCSYYILLFFEILPD